MKLSKNYQRCLISLVLLTLLGCGAMYRKTMTIYSLASEPFIVPQAPSNDRVMAVLPMYAPEAFATTQMAQVKYRAYDVRYFANVRWTAPPAPVITTFIIDALRASGHFRLVTGAPSYKVTADFYLRTRLLDMHQAFISAPSQVHIVIGADLIDAHTNTIIASTTFGRDIPVKEFTPAAGAVAYNAALREILPEIVRFCIEVV